MRKAAVLVSIILMMMSIHVVKAEDETEWDENGSIVTDLPYGQEMEGEVFGALYGNIDEDIDIDIPVNEEPEKPKEGAPSNPQEDEAEKDPSRGSSDDKVYGGKNASTLSLRPNIADANQEVYGINADGTGKDGVVYYRWIEEKEHLTIYPALITKAKQEKKNIVMRIVDRKEKNYAIGCGCSIQISGTSGKKRCSSNSERSASIRNCCIIRQRQMISYIYCSVSRSM